MVHGLETLARLNADTKGQSRELSTDDTKHLPHIVVVKCRGEHGGGVQIEYFGRGLGDEAHLAAYELARTVADAEEILVCAVLNRLGKISDGPGNRSSDVRQLRNDS